MVELATSEQLKYLVSISASSSNDKLMADTKNYLQNNIRCKDKSTKNIKIQYKTNQHQNSNIFLHNNYCEPP